MCNPDQGPETGGESITRWRFATGEVGGGPLKNRGGHEAALKEGGGVQGLTARPAIFAGVPPKWGQKRGQSWSELNTTERRGGEAGELRGKLARNYNPVGGWRCTLSRFRQAWMVAPGARAEPASESELSPVVIPKERG